MTPRFVMVSMSSVLALAACGGDDDACDPVAATGCEDGRVCEFVDGGEPACFNPFRVRGSVFDLATTGAVEGAQVVALDINGAPISSVAVTDANGDYSLPLPATRDADGNPIPVELTLRADADGYQTFPSGVRQALPIDTGAAVSSESGYVIETAQTDIGLVAFDAGGGSGIIFGSVETPPNGAGVLVVAEGAGGAGFNSIASRDGDYRIFNLPDDTYTVTAYAQGVNYAPESASVAGDSAEVDLALDGREPGVVSGDVQIVNAPGGALTSVVLVVESTFSDTLERGQTVPGLRAPEPGVAPNVAGAYTIEGVPAGRYVVLGAFENDDLVRDPDTSIGGTSTLQIEVTPGATTTVDGFKITEALAVLSPGADGPEQISSATPTFSWQDDSSEDEYVVQVFDSFGNEVWTTTIPGVSGDDPSVTYAGPALEAGMYYQFRATSFKGTPLSRTEDLKGVFYLP